MFMRNEGPEHYSASIIIIHKNGEVEVVIQSVVYTPILENSANVSTK